MDKNVNWKGNEVSYISLHQWVRTNKHIPKECECCKKIARLDAHNKDGLYTRDLSTWEFLCRKCHMTKDGRILQIKSYVKIKRTTEICQYCNLRFRFKKSCGDKECVNKLKNERRRAK